MVYADNAATTKLDIEAFEAMKPFFLDSYSNPSQPYSFSRIAKKALKEARNTIAHCIGADPEEIFFTSGGTESDNWAVKCAGKGGNIVTSKIEHHAILNSCKTYERNGGKVSYVSVDRNGLINIKEVEKCINESTRLISVMFANNEIGTIQPIAKLAKLAHEHNCLFHTDAVQAVGHIKINVHEFDIDFLSASAHKFNGPKGIGFFYVKKGINISPFIDGGSQEFGQRAGTENVAMIVAMAVALKNSCDNIEKNTKKLQEFEDYLITELGNMGIDYLQNGATIKIPGNISLSFRGYEGEAILHRLDLMGISVSTGSACDGESTQISHVIKAIGVPVEYAKGTIRISLGKYNTKEDIDTILSAFHKIFCK